MLRLAAIVRFLMLVVCLVPFTSTQQAAGALAPLFPSAPVPAGEVPAPRSEEDDERETDGEDAKERHASHARHRTPVRELTGFLPTHAVPPMHVTCPRTAPPVAADPFHNGLGTPYRC